MAINENDLHDKIQNALIEYAHGDYKNEMQNPRQMKIMGDEMREYFEENTVITYGWKAANTSGIPDPTRSFVSEVTFPAFDLTHPMNLPGLATKIMAAFQGAKIKHPAAWTLPDGTFLIKTLVLPYSGREGALMNSIVRPVCTWAKTLINPSPLSGKHGAFSGATNSMSIA